MFGLYIYVWMIYFTGVIISYISVPYIIFNIKFN